LTVQTKLFLDLYLVKILDISNHSFRVRYWNKIRK